jgi:RNA-directed DNA polymerase
VLRRWIKRRHPEKNAQWRNKKYFRIQGMKRWIFSVKLKNKRGKSYFLDLFSAAQTPIRRHIKIKAEANPYDPKYTAYFFKRERLKLAQYRPGVRGSTI